MTSLVAQGVQSRHFKKGYMLLVRPRPCPSSQGQLQIAHLRGSQVGWLFCLRTFLKGGVLESSKVKERSEIELLKGKMKTLGVCRGDSGMSGDKTRRQTENKQKPQVSLLSTAAQEPCLLQIKVKDESQSIHFRKPASSMREVGRGQQDTLIGKRELRGTGKCLERTRQSPSPPV